MSAGPPFLSATPDPNGVLPAESCWSFQPTDERSDRTAVCADATDECSDATAIRSDATAVRADAINERIDAIDSPPASIATHHDTRRSTAVSRRARYGMIPMPSRQLASRYVPIHSPSARIVRPNAPTSCAFAPTPLCDESMHRRAMEIRSAADTMTRSRALMQSLSAPILCGNASIDAHSIVMRRGIDSI